MIFHLTPNITPDVSIYPFLSVISLLIDHFKAIQYEAMEHFEIICIAIDNDEDNIWRPRRHRYNAHIHYYDEVNHEYIDIYGKYKCEFKFTPEEYDVLVNGSDEDAMKVIARRVVDSLSNLDRLSRKAAAFDKDHFRAEVVKLFKENDLIPEDYPLPWGNKKKRTRTKAKTDKEPKTPKE